MRLDMEDIRKMDINKYRDNSYTKSANTLILKIEQIKENDKLRDKLGLRQFQIDNIILSLVRSIEYRDNALEKASNKEIKMCMYYMDLFDCCIDTVNVLDNCLCELYNTSLDTEQFRDILYNYELIQSYTIPHIGNSTRVVCSSIIDSDKEGYDFSVILNSSRLEFKYTDIFNIQAYYCEVLNKYESLLDKLIDSEK